MELSDTIPVIPGHYRILRKIGSGGLGQVFQALDRYTGKTVAIKVLHEKFARNRKIIGTFHRELLIIAGLHHKHIVSYLDSYFDPPLCYIVTEFVEGWSGHDFLCETGQLPPLVALSILTGILQGIDYLHLHDTVHSDLSSANYLIDKTGRVCVTDFGLSCRLNVEDYKNYMIGTPGYYSPEHITENAISPQTDIYCAGLILYEMITREKAIPVCKDQKTVLHAMKRIDFNKIICSDREMQISLRKIIKSSLNFRRSGRLQNAETMLYFCYEIMKKYKVIYPDHAIRKFLADCQLSKVPFKGHYQDIYRGFLPRKQSPPSSAIRKR